jgi:UDP-3-O-[3-hydroxymyristoyl] glucosamine N-acyltransferase
MKFSEIAEKLSPWVKISSLAEHIALDPDLHSIASIDESSAGQLSYIEGAKFANQVETTQATALILPMNEALQAQAIARGIPWIASSDPRLLFAQAIRLFYQPFQPQPQIHPTAIVDPTVQLGQDVSIGAHVVIQAGVVIGNQVCIHPNVVIYPQVFLGDRSLLHANCTIHERSQLGSDCVIHSGAVIGAEGFGFVPTAQGWFKMEQSGYVVLEDGVEIGCNSTVDRPAVGTTRIGRNTKLDNLVHVAHGCQIGQNVAMAAQVGLAGGVKVGNRVILAGQVGVANQAVIGEGAIATAQAGIHNDIAAGEIVSGSPSVSNSLYLKVSAIYKKLPEMYKSLKAIQKKLGDNEDS